MTHGKGPDLLKQLQDERARLAELENERNLTLQRIAELEAAIRGREAQEPRPGSSKPAIEPTDLTAASQTAEKVALFRRRFRGREDVYPQRWENKKKGTTGYSPACANEWARGICEKPRVKCSRCQHQAFIPVTDKVVLDHLLGRQTIGVYPLLQDDTCWFLAMDLEGAHWQDDVAAILDTCVNLGLPAAVERSRSGQGAHIWFFFQEALPAGTARKVGDYLISETRKHRHDLPLQSYDRLFPSQDTLPRGGFGNLIALPFQDGPRRQGNSVFVDQHWVPCPDQWAYLASLELIPQEQPEALAASADTSTAAAPGSASLSNLTRSTGSETRGAASDLTPEMRAALPDSLQCVLDKALRVPKAGLPAPLLDRIKRLASFQNPEFYKRQRMRLSTALTPRVIDCSEDLGDSIRLPRGCLQDLRETLSEEGVGLEICDERSNGAPLDVAFDGRLTQEQGAAFKAMCEHVNGVLVAPPGSGKTVIGIRMIAERARNTLVLVHRAQLVGQWRAQIGLFLSRDPRSIGQLGAGKRNLSGSLDVAMVQSFLRQEDIAETLRGYGHIVVDECHHVPAVSVERLLKEATARFITGLTATPNRRDGQEPILRYQIGPVRYTIEVRKQVDAQSFKRRLVLRETAFSVPEQGEGPSIQDVYRTMSVDEDRNRLIVDDVIAALEEGRSPLLLTERRDHVDYLAEELDKATRNLIVLRGGMGRKQRQAELEKLRQIPDEEERLVIATGRYIGEGFDDARLDTLFLTMPISWRGTLVQYAGRLHRQHVGKTEVRIVDYADRGPLLEKMLKRRMRGYRSLGYVVGEKARGSLDAVREPQIIYERQPGGRGERV